MEKLTVGHLFGDIPVDEAQSEAINQLINPKNAKCIANSNFSPSGSKVVQLPSDIEIVMDSRTTPSPTVTRKLNLSLEEAKILVSEKLVTLHSLELPYDSWEDEPFTIDATIKLCDENFGKLDHSIQNALFGVGLRIEHAICEALSANLGLVIFDRLIRNGLLWPNIHKWLGIPEPTIYADLIGHTEHFRITEESHRNEVVAKLTKNNQLYMSEVQGILLTQFIRDGRRTQNHMLAEYEHRYNQTLDNTDFKARISAPLVNILREQGQSESQIELTLADLIEELKNTVDNALDTLIYFVFDRCLKLHKANLYMLFLHEDKQQLFLDVQPFRETYIVNKADLEYDTTVNNSASRARQNLQKRPDGRPSALAQLALASQSSTANNAASKAKQDANAVISRTNKADNRQKASTPQQPLSQARASTTHSVRQTAGTPTGRPPLSGAKRSIPVCSWDSKGCLRGNCDKRHFNTQHMPCPYGRQCKIPKCKFGAHDHDPIPIEDMEEMGEEIETTPKRHKPESFKVSITHSPEPNDNNIVVSPIAGIKSRHRTTQRTRRVHRHWRKTRLSLLEDLCIGISNLGVNVLHDCVLSREEMLTLTLGAKCVPPPCISLNKNLSLGFSRYANSVRVKKYFCNIPSTTRTGTVEENLHYRIKAKASVKAQYASTGSRNPLEIYLKQAYNKILALNKTPLVRNKTCAQWRAVHDIASELRARTDIIVKTADKNLGLTVMRRSWYIDEGLSVRQLGNEKVYKNCVETPNVADIVENLKIICDKQSWCSRSRAYELFSDLTTEFTDNRIKLCRLYFLPKLHKNPVTLRAICASQGWVTYWTSVYLHMLVLPLLQLIPTYLSNSAQLVKVIENIRLPKYYQFVEADVDNLYPSIDIPDGLLAMKKFLKKVGWHQCKIAFVIDLFQWVLTNNYLSFGNRIFLQISGTAMGTPCAVVFACVYMHILEEEAMNRFLYQHNDRANCIYLRKRFIDDLSMIFSDHDLALLFMNIFNSVRPWIKLTFRIRNSETQFLDLTLYKTKDQQGIKVKAYTKVMNKFLFLPPQSCHPKHCFAGWIRGYCQRLRVNCSEDRDYLLNIEALRSRLIARGYRKAFIDPLIAATPSRTMLLAKSYAKHTRTKDIGTPFILTYTHLVHQLLPLIKNAIELTEIALLDTDTATIFGNRKTPLIAFQRGKNLKEIIAPSALTTTDRSVE